MTGSSEGSSRKHLGDEALIERVATGGEVMLSDAECEAVVHELSWPDKDRGLSQRESEVLALLADGLTNAEIGEALHLGAETVKTYVRQAYDKLGFRNRVQAATYVVRSPAFSDRQSA